MELRLSWFNPSICNTVLCCTKWYQVSSAWKPNTIYVVIFTTFTLLWWIYMIYTYMIYILYTHCEQYPLRLEREMKMLLIRYSEIFWCNTYMYSVTFTRAVWSVLNQINNFIPGTPNSLRPSDAYMHQQTCPPLVQTMACCLFSTKSLSKPMLNYRTKIWLQCLKMFEYDWKCCLQNGSNFILASNSSSL